MLIQSEQDDAETLAAEDAAIAAAEKPVTVTPIATGGDLARMIEALADGDATPLQRTGG